MKHLLIALCAFAFLSCQKKDYYQPEHPEQPEETGYMFIGDSGINDIGLIQDTTCAWYRAVAEMIKNSK